MCLFSWGGKKPLLEIYPKHWLWTASVVSNYFLPGCAGVNTVCYQRMALILFYSFKKIEQKIITNHWALYLGNSELKWNFCVKLKTLHMPSSSPFWMGFSFSVFFGIWMGNAYTWLGSCPNWVLWWSGVETSSPSLWHTWGTERGKYLFSWAGGYNSEKMRRDG